MLDEIDDLKRHNRQRAAEEEEAWAQFQEEKARRVGRRFLAGLMCQSSPSEKVYPVRFLLTQG